MIILSVEDSIERSLDMLDESYSVMTKILDKPIFFDSVEVRSVVHEISNSRDAVLLVAKELTSISKNENYEKEKEEE